MRKLVFIFSFIAPLFLLAQQVKYVDVISAKVDVSFEEKDSIKGHVRFLYKLLKPLDTIVIDAKNMKITNFYDNHYGLDFAYDGKQIKYAQELEPGKIHELNIFYKAKPKKALYTLKRKGDWNIWTQGQGKYTSNWLPSFDDVNQKIEFDISVTFDEDYTVLANGKLDSVQKSEGFKTWHYNMQKPMSSYLVALAIGKYDKKTETSKSGIPLEFYYYPEDSLKVEPTYRYSKKMFDFLEEEIGFAYPWQNYKQVPVYDFLYSGMENTSLTIFSDAFMVDSIGFNDKNYVNVNAHELAHQWFGDVVTATSGEHHWLQEGFATYYALLAEKEVFGEDYYYFKLYKSAQDLRRQDQSNAGTSLLNPKASSLTFYQRGAWVLHALRNNIGDNVFKKAVKNYLEKHQFSNVSTNNFISEIERLSGRKLTTFVQKWIVKDVFPFEDAVRLVHKQSSYIQEYVQVNCEANTSKCTDYLKYYISDDAKVKVIAQRPQLIDKNAFQNELKVRQAISRYLQYIPKSLKAEYESLLDDKSYITIESALYNLWTAFPGERSKYLSKTRNIEGFNDKNVKMLWLLLHFNTPQYNADGKGNIIAELLDYTNNYHGAETRMNAFRYLKLMNACRDLCKSNLEEAKTHHNWRMVKFAKDMINELNNPKK